MEEEFAYEDEDLVADLSGVGINLIKDVHDESIEVTVEAYGRDGLDGVPIVEETFYDFDLSEIELIGA